MRFFYHPEIPAAGGVTRLGEEEAFHAVRVLRLRPGDALRLLDGHGRRAEAEIESVLREGRREAVNVRIVRCEAFTPPACRLRLLVAPPRAKLFNQLLRDAAELGVWRITPILCEFSTARPDGEAADHWRADLVSAAKQSGNPFLPELDPPQSFAAALAAAPAAGVFGDVADADAPFTLSVPPPPELAVWIGPEGGFSQAERTRLLEHGCRPLRLGCWILRVETAVTALLGHLLGIAGHDLACHPHSA